MPNHNMTTAEALKAIRQELIAKGNADARDFFAKVVPGIRCMYGVKTPGLNLLATKYKHHGFALAEALWKAGAHEEKIIAIKILEKTGKKDPDTLLKVIGEFAKGIDNWAVCDGIGMLAFRSVVKTHRDQIFAMAARYSTAKDPWQRRLSLVMVEWYTRHSSDHAAIKKLVKSLENDEEYYVRKAVNWVNRNLDKGK